MEYSTISNRTRAIDALREVSDGNDVLSCACVACVNCFASDSGLYRECPGCGAPIRNSGVSRCSCGTAVWVCGSVDTSTRVVTIYSIGTAASLITTCEETI